MSFYKVLEKVGNNEMDLGVGNYSITDERKMFLSFTKPIMPSFLQFITLTSSPINTIQDIKGKTVGIELLSVALTVAREQFQDDVKIINFHRVSLIMEAVADHKVDVGLTDACTTKYWVNNNAPLFKLIGPRLPIGQGYAFFATKGNTGLIARINTALDEIKADGTFAKIYAHYFGM